MEKIFIKKNSDTLFYSLLIIFFQTQNARMKQNDEVLGKKIKTLIIHDEEVFK